MPDYPPRPHSRFFDIFIVIFFLQAALVQTSMSLSWGRDSWQITEWLINYSGGFVRRGLPGELISYLSSASGFYSNHLAIAFSIAIFALLFGCLAYLSRGRFSIPFILSPVLLGSAVYSDFMIRKDALGVLLLVACLYVHKNCAIKLARILLLNGIAVIAILSHEAFFFLGLPALIFLNSGSRSSDLYETFISLLKSALLFLPALLAFVATVIFKGNSTIAHAVNDSLIDTWLFINPATCCTEVPVAALDGLQWTTSKGLELTYGLLTKTEMGIWIPLAWLVTIAICFICMIVFCEEDRAGNAGATQKNLATVLIFQLLMISPLFILGWDYGRWIFLWTTSAAVIFAFGYDFNHLSIVNRIADLALRPRIMNSRPHIFYLLMLGIPPCCWTVYGFLATSPIGYSVNFFTLFFP